MAQGRKGTGIYRKRYEINERKYQMFKEIKSMAEFFNYDKNYKHVWPNKDCTECYIEKDEGRRVKINWAIPTPTCAWYEESREHPSYSLLDRACDNCRGKK